MNALYCSKTWVYCTRLGIQGYYVWLHFSLSELFKRKGKRFLNLRNLFHHSVILVNLQDLPHDMHTTITNSSHMQSLTGQK